MNNDRLVIQSCGSPSRSHHRLSSRCSSCLTLSRIKKAPRGEKAGRRITGFLVSLAQSNRKVRRGLTTQHRRGGRSKLVAAAGMAVQLPSENFRVLQIAGKPVTAFVTNNSAEVEEWVAQLEREWPGPKIVGISFFWEPCRLTDGTRRQKVSAVHVSYLANVLVYHLSRTPNRTIPPQLFNFLCDTRHSFFGDDIYRVLMAMGIPIYGRQSLTMELSEIATFFGVSIAGTSTGQIPYHLALAAILLTDLDTRLLHRDSGNLRRCTWPMNDLEIQIAAERSFVAQKLGMHAFASNAI